MSETKTYLCIALADVVDPDTYRTELLKTALVFPPECGEVEEDGSQQA